MSIQLRRLQLCYLLYFTKVKQKNGSFIDKLIEEKKYKISVQELTDQVSANIYGANINKTYRISSPCNLLEKYLTDKVSNKEDNISKYFVLINDKKYKIISVKTKWIDVELL